MIHITRVQIGQRLNCSYHPWLNYNCVVQVQFVCLFKFVIHNWEKLICDGKTQFLDEVERIARSAKTLTLKWQRIFRSDNAMWRASKREKQTLRKRLFYFYFKENNSITMSVHVNFCSLLCLRCCCVLFFHFIFFVLRSMREHFSNCFFDF